MATGNHTIKLLCVQFVYLHAAIVCILSKLSVMHSKC